MGDKDLETQALVRRQRDMKVERIMSDVSQVEPALNNMNQKIVDINDTVRGVKRDLQLQMDSQSTMRKELMVVLEEKTKMVRVLEEKIQMVTQSVERDREHNHVAIRQIQEEINKEREEREEFEESIMRLVDDQLTKLHTGIEKHPGVEGY